MIFLISILIFFRYNQEEEVKARKDDLMTEQDKIVAYIVSDSIGQSAVNLVRAGLSKFKEMNYKIKDYTFISNPNEIEKVVADLKSEENALVFNALINHEISELLEKELKKNDIKFTNMLEPIINRVTSFTGLELDDEDEEHKLRLDDRYFDRIDALEFAVQHDDGKEPKGFLEAEVVILGISRTSKTPLSIYLANNNYKVANLPLMPESEIPEEIWQVDHRRVFGLTNDVKVLSEIRKERMISYGLNPETIYSDTERIEEEIAYAHKLYEELDCKIINVSNKSIEETAALIIGSLNESGLIEVVEES